MKLKQDIKIINIGLKGFYESLKKQNAKVIHVDFRPPASGEKKLIKILNKMTGLSIIS